MFSRTEPTAERRSEIAELGRSTALALAKYIHVTGTTIRDVARACGVSETRARKWVTNEWHLPLAFLAVRQVPIAARLELAWIAMLASGETPGDEARIARAIEKFGREKLDAALAKEK